MKECFPNSTAKPVHYDGSQSPSSATQQALSDYADTLTVVAAGQSNHSPTHQLCGKFYTQNYAILYTFF